MSFPIIGAAPAVPIHQYTKTVSVSDWSNGTIIIPKSEHKLEEPIVSVQKKYGTSHDHVIVEKISVEDTTKTVTVFIPVGNEFDGKIIIN